MRLACLAGGLKMVDIKVFMKSLKITWIRRLFRYNNAPWIKLLQAETSICLTKNLSLWSTIFVRNDNNF